MIPLLCEWICIRTLPVAMVVYCEKLVLFLGNDIGIWNVVIHTSEDFPVVLTEA